MGIAPESRHCFAAAMIAWVSSSFVYSSNDATGLRSRQDQHSTLEDALVVMGMLSSSIGYPVLIQHLKVLSANQINRFCQRSLLISSEDFDGQSPYKGSDAKSHVIISVNRQSSDQKCDPSAQYRICAYDLSIPSCLSKTQIKVRSFNDQFTTSTLIAENAKPRSCAALKNQHFTFAAYESNPHIVQNEAGKWILGLSIEMFKSASVFYNFTYSIQTFPVKYFKHPNGSWGGIMGALTENQVDFLFSSVAPTSDRLGSVDFSTFGFFFKISFITGLPAIKLPGSAFFEPFEFEVWLVFAFLSVACAVTLYFVNCQGDSKQPSIMAVSSVVAMSLSQAPPKMKRLSKISFICWLFGFILTSNYYNSNLLSCVTLPNSEEVPRRFKVLAQRSDYSVEISLAPGTTSQKFFDEVNISTFATLRKRYKKASDSVSCVVHAATQIKHACISSTMYIDMRIHGNLMLYKNFLPVVKASKPIQPTFLYSVLPKCSKYFKGFDFLTGWARDCGLTFKWFKDVLSYKGLHGRQKLKNETELVRKLKAIATSTMQKSVEPFRLQHLATAFEVLLAGCGVSIFVFLATIISHRKR